MALPLAGTAADSVSASSVPGATSIIAVGPQRAIKTIGEAARLADDNAIIEIDAGDYLGDVAVWTRDNLTVRAAGGRVRLVAHGAAAEGKGIWVVRARNFKVQGIEFIGARVADRNGAGIRFESGNLEIRDCRFIDNENGLLAGNDRAATVNIEDSEFGFNGHGDGQSHNIYVGTIRHLRISGSSSHHAKVGHLLKSRAALSEVYYNRLVDGEGGRASYELEFPSGGIAVVVGNIIEQGPETENPHLIAIGAEGFAWPVNQLFLASNTLIDSRPSGGILLRSREGLGAIQAVNNLIVGAGSSASLLQPFVPTQGNYIASPEDFDVDGEEPWRLLAKSRLVGKAVAVQAAGPHPLQPTREFVYPRGSQAIGQEILSPGAFQPLARGKR